MTLSPAFTLIITIEAVGVCSTVGSADEEIVIIGKGVLVGNWKVWGDAVEVSIGGKVDTMVVYGLIRIIFPEIFLSEEVN